MRMPGAEAEFTGEDSSLKRDRGAGAIDGAVKGAMTCSLEGAMAGAEAKFLASGSSFDRRGNGAAAIDGAVRGASLKGAIAGPEGPKSGAMTGASSLDFGRQYLFLAKGLRARYLAAVLPLDVSSMGGASAARIR